MISPTMVLMLALVQAPVALPAAAAVEQLPVFTFEQAIAEAQKNNYDLQQARARLTQSQEISSKVWAAYLPTIAVGGSYTRNNAGVEFALPSGYFVRELGAAGVAQNGPPFDKTQPISLDNPPGSPASTVMMPSAFESLVIQKLNQFGAQVSVNQALIVPALWPAISNAYLAEKVAATSVEAARREILFGVAQLYYGAAALKEATSVQERSLAIAVSHEKDARVQVEAGAVPKIALLRAQIDRARAEQDLMRAQNAYASAKVGLGTLTGHQGDFDLVRPAEPQLPRELSNSEAAALQNRPDVQAARSGAELADRTRGATWYKYAPSLFFNAAYRIANMKGFSDAYDSWALTFALNWTLWDGGLRESELRENAAKLVEADAAARGAEAKAVQEVRQTLLDLESARANRVKAEEQVKLARENNQLVTVNYESGAATQLEVSDAANQLQMAEQGLIAESLNAQLAALRLLKVIGEFNPQPAP